MIYDNTTIFDFETTGLDSEKDRIIEVAIIRIRKGKVIGTMSYLVNPEVNIPNKISEITGIRNEDVTNCPTIRQLFPWLMSIIGDSLLVAHNALFDLSFLETNNNKLREKSISNNFIDTRAICIDQFPYESHRLELMCAKFDIKLEGAHRALNDVNATWTLLEELNKITNVHEYINKLYYFKKYGKPNWSPIYANIIGL